MHGQEDDRASVASRLGMTYVELNAIARRLPLSASEGEFEVDVRKLRSSLLRGRISGAVVSGHLLPAVLKDGELGFLAVLRCEPMVLKRRLLLRGYDQEKVVENLEAELIGVVLDEALRAFGADLVHEYDTTRRRPATIARMIAEDFRSRTPQKVRWIDWTLGYDSTRLRSLLSPASTEPAST